MIWQNQEAPSLNYVSSIYVITSSLEGHLYTFSVVDDDTIFQLSSLRRVTLRSLTRELFLENRFHTRTVNRVLQS